MLGPVHFHDDKMGDGLRTLFHFERLAKMAPVHFFALEISRRKMDDGLCTLFHFECFAMAKVVP